MRSTVRFRTMALPALVAVLFLCWPAPAPCQGRDSSSLRLMTFNIRFGKANDGEDRWENRRELLIRVIDDFSPDILGLQEALRFQIDEIRSALPQYGEIGVGRDDGQTKGEYSAILYKPERLRVVQQQTFWFSDTPELPGSISWGNAYTRICTWGQFQDVRRGMVFVIYNLHLDHMSQPSREKSVEALLRVVNGRPEGDPVVIMGDFNAGEKNPAIRSISFNGFHDTYRLLHPADSLVATYHAFRGAVGGDKIDYIFIDGQGSVLEASIIRTQQAGHFPSDHFPVTAVIQLKRKGHEAR